MFTTSSNATPARRILNHRWGRFEKEAQYWEAAMDITARGLALIVLAPVFLVIATTIKFTSKGPVFFHQTNMLLGDGAH